MVTCNEMAFEIKSYLSEDLATRNRATQFFKVMESTKADSVIVDFADVKSISRSFADEYVKRKKASHKGIKERNVPSNVRKMFDIVSSPAEKRQLVNFDKLRIRML